MNLLLLAPERPLQTLHFPLQLCDSRRCVLRLLLVSHSSGGGGHPGCGVGVLATAVKVCTREEERILVVFIVVVGHLCYRPGHVAEPGAVVTLDAAQRTASEGLLVVVVVTLSARHPAGRAEGGGGGQVGGGRGRQSTGVKAVAASGTEGVLGGILLRCVWLFLLFFLIRVRCVRGHTVGEARHSGGSEDGRIGGGRAELGASGGATFEDVEGSLPALFWGGGGEVIIPLESGLAVSVTKGCEAKMCGMS